MKRRLFTCLVLALTAVALFVSCSPETKAVDDAVAYVRFGKETRDLSADYTTKDYSTLYWFYTATKNDSYGTTGQKTALTPVTTSGDNNSTPAQGLSGTIGPFSSGEWTFSLVAYKENNTSSTKIYEASSFSVTLTGGETKVVAVTVDPVGDTGTLKFNNAYFSYAEAQAQTSQGITASAPLFKLVATKTTPTTESGSEYKTYTLTNDSSETEATSITLACSDDSKQKYTIAFADSAESLSMETGTYRCVATAYLDDTNETVIKTQTFYFGIYSGGAVTTLSGDLTEDASSYVKFDVAKTEIITQTLTLTDAGKSNAMTFTSKIATTSSATDTTNGDTVEIAFAEGAIEVSESDKFNTVDYAINAKVNTEAAGDSSFVVKGSDDSAVMCSIDLSMDKLVNGVKTDEVDTFNEPVTIKLFIGTGLDADELKVIYTGADSREQPTKISYNSSSGYITFNTTHFSNFAVLYKVTMPVAKVVSDKKTYYYDTFEEAVSRAKEGSTITLLKDLDLTYYQKETGNVFTFEKNVTLDLNEKTVKSYNLGVVYEGDGLTIKNGTFECVNGGSYALFIGGGSCDEGTDENYDISDEDGFYKLWTATIDNIKCTGGINVLGHKLIVKSSECIEINGTDYYALWADTYGQITVNGGTFTSTSKKAGIVLRTAVDKDSTITINGGTFKAENDVTLFGGNISVTGGSFSEDPSKYVKSNYKAIKDDCSGTWTVSKYYDELYEFCVAESSYTKETFPLFYINPNNETITKKDDVTINGLLGNDSKTIISEWQDLWAYGNVTIKNFEFENGATISAGYYGDEITIKFEDCIFHGTDQIALFKAARNNGTVEDNQITNAPTFKRSDNSRNEMGLIIRTNKDGNGGDAKKTVDVVISNCSFVGKNDSNAERKSAWKNYTYWNNNDTSQMKGSYGIGLGSCEDNTYHMKSALIEGCTFEGINGHAINVAAFNGEVTIQNNIFTSYGVNAENLAANAASPKDVAIRGELQEGGSLTLSGNEYNSTHDNKKIDVGGYSGTAQ